MKFNVRQAERNNRKDRENKYPTSKNVAIASQTFLFASVITVKIKIFLNHNEKNKLKAKFIKCMRINASHCQYSIK